MCLCIANFDDSSARIRDSRIYDTFTTVTVESCYAYSKIHPYTRATHDTVGRSQLDCRTLPTRHGPLALPQNERCTVRLTGTRDKVGSSVYVRRYDTCAGNHSCRIHSQHHTLCQLASVEVCAPRACVTNTRAYGLQLLIPAVLLAAESTNDHLLMRRQSRPFSSLRLAVKHPMANRDALARQHRERAEGDPVVGI